MDDIGIPGQTTKLRLTAAVDSNPEIGTPDTASGRFVRFRSDDNAITTARPQLTVSYNTSVDLLPIIEPGSAPAAMRGVAAALAGSVTNASGTGWSMVSGPGIVSFPDTTNPATTAFFSEPGNYLLGLTTPNPQGEASRTLTADSRSSSGVDSETILSHDPATDLDNISVAVPTGTGGQRFVRLRVRRE